MYHIKINKDAFAILLFDEICSGDENVYNFLSKRTVYSTDAVNHLTYGIKTIERKNKKAKESIE